MLKLALVYFTQSGEQVANKLVQIADISFTIYDKQNSNLKDFVKNSFEQMDGIIFICATGIAVRLIAPYIKTKDKDAAVLVLDDWGQYVIPILSGHLGGANYIANLISQGTGAIPVITTSTDIHNCFAVDIWSNEQGCLIADISAIKHVSSAILRGESVSFQSDFPYEENLPKGLTAEQKNEVGIIVSLNEEKKPFPITLNVIPQIVTIGVGCKKNTDSQLFEAFVLKTLKELDISIKAVKYMTSIELKKEENCILQFCIKYSLLPKFYTAEELNNVCGEFAPSEFVKKTTGTDNVCERSALWGGGKSILLKKKLSDGMTIAVSKENWQCGF